MFTGLELMACQNLAVPAQVMQHVVQVESHGNPYAIGVVGARLLRQPHNLDEALATVHMLDAGSHDYSLGMAQVHRANLRPYGLDSYRQAFAPCANVAAGARILADCYARFGRDWGKAFSCYYSGNPATGFRDGYVQKIYAAMPHGTGAASTKSAPAMHNPVPAPSTARSRQPTPGDRFWRLAIRSAPVDQTSATYHASTPAAAESGPQEPESALVVTPHAPVRVTVLAGGQTGSARPGIGQAATEPFVPRVRGPRDPVPVPANRGLPPPMPATPGTGPPDLPMEHRDAAFVF
jgi:type IV secretion system protein VirB1